MAIFQVKKYKTINGQQIAKSKEQWNKETKNGTMTWYFSTRYTINNKRKQYKSRLFALKRDAEEEERLFLSNPTEYIEKFSKRAKNVFEEEIARNTKTLNEYFKDFFEYELTFNKESTAYEYKSSWINHMADDLGNLVPSDINLALTQKWHDNMNTKICPQTNRTYAIKTKNKVHACLSEFYQYLYKKGLLELNYSKIIGNFKNPNENKNKKKEIKYQTLEQYNEFMKIVDDDFWFTLFNFAFWHGCRMGEQRSLKIKDIDLFHNTIHIHTTFAKGKDGKEIIGPIKNNRERTIYLATQSKPYIEKLINLYKNMDNYSDDWFLFGGYLCTTKNKIQRTLKKYYNLLKLNNPNINELTHHEFGRHSHASYLLDKGLGRQDIYNIIGLRLGDSAEVIRLTYAHPYENNNNDKVKELLN